MTAVINPEGVADGLYRLCKSAAGPSTTQSPDCAVPLPIAPRRGGFEMSGFPPIADMRHRLLA
jgi:hypothetical protein